MVTESRELWQLLGQKPEKEGTFQKTSRKQPPAGRGYEQRNFHGEGPAVASFSARGLNGEGEDVPGLRGSLREGTGQGAQASGPSGISAGTPGQAGLGQGEVLTVGSPSPSPLGNGPGRLEPPSWNPASTLAPEEDARPRSRAASARGLCTVSECGPACPDSRLGSNSCQQTSVKCLRMRSAWGHVGRRDSVLWQSIEYQNENTRRDKHRCPWESAGTRVRTQSRPGNAKTSACAKRAWGVGGPSIETV